MDYKPGLLAAAIFEGKKKSSNSVLNDLFSKKVPDVKVKKTKDTLAKTEHPKSQKKEEKDTAIRDTLKEIANTSVVKKGKKTSGKRKHEDTTPTPTMSKKMKKDSSESGQEQPHTNPDNFPFVHESLLKKSQQQEGKKEKTKLKKDDDDDELQYLPFTRRKRDKTSDKRTIFVGNCPLSVDDKALKGIFKEYGAIESVRFRCGAPARLELPKRAVMIKKEFHEKAKSYVGFVVFESEETATKALEKNGHLVDGHHLRVDLASNQNQHDKRKSVFVGNLPFSVTEEDLRSHFEDCGDILNIRVVRDRQTSIGKGIAFIQFDSKDGVILAQKLNDMEFQDRKLRVMRCSSKVKQKDMEDNPKMTNYNPKISRTKSKPVTFKGKAKDYYSRSEPRIDKRKTNFAPTNKTTKKSFLEVFEAKKEKRVNKKIKRKLASQKSDGLSSIFGDIQADMKKLKMENPKFKTKKPKDKKKEKMKAKRKLQKAKS